MSSQFTRLVVITAASFCLCSGLTFTVDAKAKKNRQDVRLYKVNKDGITQRLRFTKRKAKREGCQNLLLKSRVFKISQFGYKHCVVYSKKNCEEDSKMEFTHSKFDDLVIELEQGYGWQPVGEHKRGERMKSWMCLSNDEEVDS